MFGPPLSDPERQRSRARRIALLTLVALMATLISLLIVVLTRVIGPVAMSTAIIPIVFGLLVTLGPIVLVLSLSRRGQREKVKRVRYGQDMYTLIDRLVDDLDDDEAAYLRRRLDERERGLENDLADDVADTLERRADDRAAGRR